MENELENGYGKGTIPEKKKGAVQPLPITSMKFIPAYYREIDSMGVIEEILEKDGQSFESQQGEFIHCTPLDLHSLPPEIVEENKETRNFILKNLEKEDESEVEKMLPLLSECLRDAKKYYQEYLHIRFPREIQNLNEFRDMESVYAFLKKTKTLKSGDGVGYMPFYCALASRIKVYLEFKKKELQGLVSENAYLKKKLFDVYEDEEGMPKVNIIFNRKIDKDWDRVGVNLDDNTDHSFIDVNLGARGKEEHRAICKMSKKPELDLTKIINDGIGVRFEVAENDLMRFVSFLVSFLERNFKRDKEEECIFVNKNLLNSRQEKMLEPLLEEYGIRFKPDDNSSSNKRFRAGYIKGHIYLPKEGEEGNMKISRPFEIQVSTIGNENEKKLSRHEVYEGTQKLSAISRDFGSFPEEYLDTIVHEASEKTKEVSRLGGWVSEEDIKEYYLKNFITPVRSKGGRGVPRYCSNEHLKRWQIAGIFPEGIDIMEGKEGKPIQRERGIPGDIAKERKRKQAEQEKIEGVKRTILRIFVPENISVSREIWEEVVEGIADVIDYIDDEVLLWDFLKEFVRDFGKRKRFCENNAECINPVMSTEEYMNFFWQSKEQNISEIIENEKIQENLMNLLEKVVLEYTKEEQKRTI